MYKLPKVFTRGHAVYLLFSFHNQRRRSDICNVYHDALWGMIHKY